MRSLNMIIGGLFVACGIIMIAGFNGITFLSVAFVLGLLFMIAGIMGCMSYRSNREDSEPYNICGRDVIRTDVQRHYTGGGLRDS